MAQQNKTTLKTYFQTGDTPNSNQYGEFIDSNLNLSETALQIGEFSISSSGNFKILGSASFAGDITSSGDIISTGKLTATSVNTGQGDNILYDMNQNVTTNSNVTFAGISFTKSVASTVVFGNNIDVFGQSFQVTITNIPEIPGFASGKSSATEDVVKMTNPSVSNKSVIIGSSTSGLGIQPFSIENGSFRFRINNLQDNVFSGGSAVFNFIML